MENKYKKGEIVFAKVNPGLKLVIRRYVDRIYYCKIQDEPGRKEFGIKKIPHIAGQNYKWL